MPTTPPIYQTFRTSALTNREVRTFRAELSAAVGGANFTYDAILLACVRVAKRHRDEVLRELREDDFATDCGGDKEGGEEVAEK